MFCSILLGATMKHFQGMGGGGVAISNIHLCLINIFLRFCCFCSVQMSSSASPPPPQTMLFGNGGEGGGLAAPLKKVIFINIYKQCLLSPGKSGRLHKDYIN